MQENLSHSLQAVQVGIECVYKMGRKRKRSRIELPLRVIIRLQYLWRRKRKVCCLLHTWIPAEDRIRIDGHTFSLKSLREYMRRTGDNRHPITRVQYSGEALSDLRISRFQLRRYKKRFLQRIEERESLSRIVLDEFSELLDQRTFQFAPFIVFMQSYLGLLEHQEESIPANISSLYGQMLNTAKAEGSATALLIYRMARSVVIP